MDAVESFCSGYRRVVRDHRVDDPEHGVVFGGSGVMRITVERVQLDALAMHRGQQHLPFRAAVDL